MQRESSSSQMHMMYSQEKMMTGLSRQNGGVATASSQEDLDKQKLLKEELLSRYSRAVTKSSLKTLLRKVH